MPIHARRDADRAFAVPLPGFGLAGDDDDILAALGLDEALDEALDEEAASTGAPDSAAPVALADLPTPAPDPGPPPPDPFALAAERFALAATPQLTLEPRAYQRAALHAWIEAGGRGMVVLPTGAGKTVLALMAVAHKARPARRSGRHYRRRAAPGPPHHRHHLRLRGHASS